MLWLVVRSCRRSSVVEPLILLILQSGKDIFALFSLVLTSAYFCGGGGKFYEQTGGVSVGSPLLSVIANFLYVKL